jgi:6-pyruvoyltetrahydropterin/6-carboxytetrahydropterin synthase
MVYEVYVETGFSSAHKLINYKGRCESLHGHNWKVGVLVATDKLGKQGMVIDFIKLKKITKKVVSQLDHKYLNKISYFKKNQPTAENIARYIFEKIKQQIKKHSLKKIKVFVWETPLQYASYEE